MLQFCFTKPHGSMWAAAGDDQDIWIFNTCDVMHLNTPKNFVSVFLLVQMIGKYFSWFWTKSCWGYGSDHYLISLAFPLRIHRWRMGRAEWFSFHSFPKVEFRPGECKEVDDAVAYYTDLFQWWVSILFLRPLGLSEGCRQVVIYLLDLTAFLT